MMNTKLMVDIATGVMEEIGMMADFGERRTTHFCEKLEAAFKEATAGAPDLRSAIPTWQERAGTSRRPETQVEMRMQAEIDDLRAALASAAPVEALTDHNITDDADDNDCGRNSRGHRIFTERAVLSFARAIEARIKGGAK